MMTGIKNSSSTLTSLVNIFRLLFNTLHLGKPGRAIFLMKQRAKLIRAKRKDNKHPVSQRLSGSAVKSEGDQMPGVETQ